MGIPSRTPVTRIVAGAAKGRRLVVPVGAARPTGDRAREAVFSALEAVRGGWSGLRVLDLYAGSGALGLEALSRGAAAVLLVEQHRPAADAIRRNAATVGLLGATVVTDDVARVLGRGVDDPYDVAFADPPYATSNEEVEQVLGLLVANGWLARGVDVVVERSRRTGAFAWPPGLDAVRERRYGEAVLWYGRAS